MDDKVQPILERLRDVEEELSHESAHLDQKRYKALAQEHSYLLDVRAAHEALVSIQTQLADNEALLQSETDLEFVEVLKEDVARLQEEKIHAAKKLQNLLVPPNPQDHANVIIELRAGTGGQEAMLFVADCVRMYQLYAAQMKWKYEPLSATESDLGGFKEYIMVLSGHNVHRYLQYEGGTHRVQRVPATEAQGRVHTSTITIAVLLEPEDDGDVELNETDLRIEATRSSGAGGQHVNKTDSAVRITHLPTGIAVFCQEERSQHKNKDKAMRLLRAKLAEIERTRKKQEVDSKRSEQVGGAERAEKIRTYNYPQNRVTDHRINLTKYNLDRVMNGDLEEFSETLVAHYQGVDVSLL